MSLWLVQYLVKLFSTLKNENQQERQLIQLTEILKDSVIGNIIKMGVSENKKLEQQASGGHRNFERIIDNASQNQIIGNNTDDRIRDAVDSAVIVVESRMHDAILPTKEDVVVPRAEMAVKWITGSSRSGPNSAVQNPSRNVFTRNRKYPSQVVFELVRLKY